MNEHPQLTALAKKFPASAIQQVPVGGGKQADYVPASLVIEKLLATIGPFGWAVQLGPSDAGTVTVIGTITATIDGREVKVSGIGNGDDWKAAESDAIKRAARTIAVGLSLWSGPAYRLDRALRLELVDDE